MTNTAATKAGEVTDAMVKAARVWLTHLHMKRQVDVDNAVRNAIEAALEAALPPPAEPASAVPAIDVTPDMVEKGCVAEIEHQKLPLDCRHYMRRANRIKAILEGALMGDPPMDVEPEHFDSQPIVEVASSDAPEPAQAADTPSEAHVAWQRRCDGGEWLQCSREQYEHTVRRGNAGVVGDNAEARALYASRPQPARDGARDRTPEEPDWKALLEGVMAELAERLTTEEFTAIAKRPAYKAAISAREGRPAMGPPRIKLQYKKRFSSDEPVEVPFDTVEPINGKLVVTFSELPQTK